MIYRVISDETDRMVREYRQVYTECHSCFRRSFYHQVRHAGRKVDTKNKNSQQPRHVTPAFSLRHLPTTGRFHATLEPFVTGYHAHMNATGYRHVIEKTQFVYASRIYLRYRHGLSRQITRCRHTLRLLLTASEKRQDDMLF